MLESPTLLGQRDQATPNQYLHKKIHQSQKLVAMQQWIEAAPREMSIGILSKKKKKK